MDDVIETGASAAPTTDAGTSSPAPSESSSAPEKTSRFAALMAEGEEESGEDPAEEASTDVDGTEDAETVEASAEKTEEAKPAEEQAPPPEDEDVPKDLKKLLKANPELRAAYYYKRDLDPLGISVEEAQTYRENIQSLEDLRITVDRSKALEAFEGLLQHPAEDAPQHFLDGLRSVDEVGADRLVKHVAKHLHEIAPEQFYEIGGRAWETGLSRLEALAAQDPFRREAVQAVREMVEELASSPQAPQAARPKPLPNPDAEELAQRRAAESQGRQQALSSLNQNANAAADREVRALVAECVKRRDPDGLLASPDVVEKIVHEVHKTVAASPANLLFKHTLLDASVPPEERVAKAASLIRARARNVVDLAFKKQTDGLAERIRKASQTKLAKAARVVTLREATGGRTATTPPPTLPKGVRPTSRDIFRATMRG